MELLQLGGVQHPCVKPKLCAHIVRNDKDLAIPVPGRAAQAGNSEKTGRANP